MRKIPQESVDAFLSGDNLNKANMQIHTRGHYVYMNLHGNSIARRNLDTGSIYISNAGWETVTTKERLNGLLNTLGKKRIFQHKFEWFIGTREFPYDEWMMVYQSNQQQTKDGHFIEVIL